MALLYALCVGVALADPSTAQSPDGAGTGAAPCQFYPTQGVGIGKNGCVDNTKFYYAGFNTATPCYASANTSTIAFGNAANLDDPNFNPRLFAVTSTGTDFQPVVCDYNTQTGAVTAGVQINGGTNLCTTAQGHNMGSLIQLKGGYVGVTGCSYDSNPNCLSASGTGGTTYSCQPIAIGNCISTDCGGANTVDITTAAHLYYLASTRFSEVSQASYGNWTLFGGQQQRAGPLTSSPGAFGLTTLRNNGTAGQPTQDTACGTNGTIYTGATGWNPVTATGGGSSGTLATACNAVFTLSFPIAGATEQFAITADTSGGSVAITFPTNGAFSSTTCTLTTTGTATTDAQSIVNAINTGSGWVSGCSTTGTYFVAARVHNCTSWTGTCTADQTVAIELKNANGSVGGAFTVTCTTTTCTPQDNRTAMYGGGTHVEFEWAQVRLMTLSTGAPVACLIMNDLLGIGAGNNGGTNNYSQLFASSYGWNQELVCTRGPDLTVTGAPGTAGVYQWGDATVASVTNPGSDGSFNAGPSYMGSFTVGSAPPTHGQQIRWGSTNGTTCPTTTAPCTGYVDVSGTAVNLLGPVKPCACTPWTGFVQPIYDHSLKNEDTLTTAGNPPPVFGAADLTIQPDGNIGIFRPCLDTSVHIQFCYETVSTSPGAQTTQEVAVENDGTTTAFTPTVAVTTTPAGHIIAFAAIPDTYPGCTHYPCFKAWISTNNGATWAAQTVTQPTWATSTTPQIAQMCNTYDTIDGGHIIAKCETANASTSVQFFDYYTGNQ